MAGSVIAAEESAADVRAREVEEQMTDGERFLLVIGVMGQIASFTRCGTSASRKGRR